MVLHNLSGPAFISWKTSHGGLRYPQDREGIPPVHSNFTCPWNASLPPWPLTYGCEEIFQVLPPGGGIEVAFADIRWHNITHCKVRPWAWSHRERNGVLCNQTPDSGWRPSHISHVFFACFFFIIVYFLKVNSSDAAFCFSLCPIFSFLIFFFLW